MSSNEGKNLLPRPPIVVVMGHVDHGKSTLIDYIRKTNIVAREAGGITQSIGAYEINHSTGDANKANKITFIDTPGHEAFSKMRSRGANVADLAILVVAADDSVKPQTKEVIELLLETKTPFVVAVNKIDKAGADVDKVKADLMQHGVLLEGYGGNISWQPISAKTGEGVSELLDLILLAAEMENLTYDPTQRAEGVIVEAKLDRQRGLEVMAVIKNGTLRIGDDIATQTASGKVKILEDFMGKRAKELAPSSPALILGFDELPEVGESFFSGKVELAEIDVQFKSAAAAKVLHEMIAKEGKGPNLRLILKADVAGSLEALSGIIRNLPITDVSLTVMNESIGDITDGDVKSAMTNGAIIIGFRVKTSKPAESLAKVHNVNIITSQIIYELIKTVEDELVRLKEPAKVGELEVLAVFNQAEMKEQLVGGKVFAGLMKKNALIEIIRNGESQGRGRITSLRQRKDEVITVDTGKECGVVVDSNVLIVVGDHLIIR